MSRCSDRSSLQLTQSEPLGNRKGKQEDAVANSALELRESRSEHRSGQSMMGSSVSGTESTCLMIRSYAAASRLSTMTPE
jgi:hypothetical protein